MRIGEMPHLRDMKIEMNDRFKIKAIAIAKDESAYIPQWVFHHLHFGFDAVEIWVNNTTDNSIEMIRALASKLGDNVVSVVEADDILAKCAANNGLFQPEAYNQAYRRESERGVYSHLMFLDMDELWTPHNFRDSIKDVLASYPDSDAISFLWMVDLPVASRAMFSRPFSTTNKFQKNRHVKSLVRISPRVRSVGIHNHASRDTVFHLADGTKFEETSDVLNVNWAYISVEQMKKRLGVPEKYFIVHQVYRSQEEYLSSLLRGRQHARDDNVFKVNRLGYVPFHSDAHTEKINIQTEALEAYDTSYDNFIAENRLEGLLESARSFIVKRYDSALSMIKSDSSLFGRYRRQLRGLRVVDEIFEKDPLIGRVERVIQSSSSGFVELKGWASDILHNRPLKFQYRSRDGRLIHVFSQKIARPDLSISSPELGFYCGFRIEVPVDVALDIGDEEINGGAIEFIAKTQDGKNACVLAGDAVEYVKCVAPKASDANIFGEVRDALFRDGILQVSGKISDRVSGPIEIYADIDGILFEFSIQREAEMFAENLTIGGFSATLNLENVPQELRTRAPQFVLIIEGVRRALKFGKAYAYPIDQIYASLNQKLPRVSIKSSMPEAEQSCLTSSLQGKETYLTYGAPDTPALALSLGVKNVVAVDSDQRILDALNYQLLAKIAGGRQKFYPVWIDIGKTKELGYPMDSSGWSRYPLYAVAPWNQCAEKGLSPDVILIDARFRVACFLVSLVMADPGAYLLFDDYVDRPQYHVVEELVKPIGAYGRLAKFVVPEQVDCRKLTRLLLQYCNAAM